MKATINSRIILVSLLLCIYFIAVFCRLEWGERYRGELFTSESALRFYYAKQVSEGHSLPTVDYKAQYPEGLELSSRNPVVMEYITGYLYRIISPPMPFVDFIRLIIPLLASLSIFALYLTVREATGDKFAGLIMSLFYALALPAITRGSGWEFLQETIALPAIFFQVYFFIKGVKSGKLHYNILSGLCIALALSSWKISQLYFLFFALFIGLSFLWENFAKRKAGITLPNVRSPGPTVAGKAPFMPGRRESRLYESSLISVIFVAGVGLTVPFLRDGMFLTSFAMIIFYALFIAIFLRRYESKLRVRNRYIFLLVLFLLILLLPQSSRNTHVYELLRYKIQFLGQKPSDPLLLPFDVRALWIDPFISPSVFEWIYFFIPLLLLGGASLWLIFRKISRGKDNTTLVFILYNTAAFLIAYLFIRRLRVFFIYFLVLLIGYLIVSIIRRAGLYRWFGIIALILALVLEFGKTMGFSTGLIFQPGLAALGITEKNNYFSAITLTSSQKELIDWIKENTGKDEVILAHYHISPVIRAYADRAVNLTSLFESKPLRDKVQEYVAALFGTEEDLSRFCEKFQSDYVVCSIDTILDDSENSWRYLADRKELNPDSAAYKLHFFPETLKRFELLYENEYFRLYRVADSGEVISPARRFAAHPLYFRADLFARSPESTSRFKAYIENVYRVYLAGSRALAAGRYAEAGLEYNTALLLAPDFPEPYAGLGAIAQNAGRGGEALGYYREYLRLSPDGLFADEIRQRVNLLK